MKVKAADVPRALHTIRQEFLKTTGLKREDLATDEAIFSLEAETVVCPACSTRFEPVSRRCPDCGLQFG